MCLIILYIWQGFEYVSGIKYARVLNVVWYSFNNIIIVMNDMLDFVHPGTPQLTNVSF